MGTYIRCDRFQEKRFPSVGSPVFLGNEEGFFVIKNASLRLEARGGGVSQRHPHKRRMAALHRLQDVRKAVRRNVCVGYTCSASCENPVIFCNYKGVVRGVIEEIASCNCGAPIVQVGLSEETARAVWLGQPLPGLVKNPGLGISTDMLTGDTTYSTTEQTILLAKGITNGH